MCSSYGCFLNETFCIQLHVDYKNVTYIGVDLHITQFKNSFHLIKTI
jgi:hypothetical protein